MILTDLFGICITPEDGVTVPVICHPDSISFALRWHQSSDKASVYVSHHHITTIGENELWHSSWKTDFFFMYLKKIYGHLRYLIELRKIYIF